MSMKEELIIKKALGIFSIQLFHQWKLTRSLWKKKEDLFEDMLKTEKLDSYKRVSHLFHFDPNGINRVITLRIHSEQKQTEILQYLISLYPNKDIFSKDSYIVIIATEEDGGDTGNFCSEFKKMLQEDFKSILVHIGVGREAKDIASLINSYQDSRQINEFLQLAHPDDSCVSFFEELEPFMLLLKGTDQKELISFYHNAIGELVAYDRNYETNFLHTLKVYLDNNGNLQQTSDDLHLSISGLRYRMERIEKLCGTDLKTGNERFKYQLAIRIHFALKVNKSNIFS